MQYSLGFPAGRSGRSAQSIEIGVRVEGEVALYLPVPRGARGLANLVDVK